MKKGDVTKIHAEALDISVIYDMDFTLNVITTGFSKNVLIKQEKTLLANY